MARLILLDASVGIAVLAADDVHHRAAMAALTSTDIEDELILAATTRAEVLVGPAGAGGDALHVAGTLVDGCTTVAVTAAIADRAAEIRASHRALSLPDALAPSTAEALEVDAVWTFDRRWSAVTTRVEIPAPV